MKNPSPYREVRDLAWVIGSPPLLDIPESLFSYEEMQVEYGLQQAWLLQLSDNPAPLQAHLQHIKRQTLGSYFESLVAFWLKHRPETRLLASNIQVQHQKTTLGEMDFIVQIANITIHLETAVKFYLGYEQKPDWHSWIGPAARDRLDIKMHSLLSRQLPLSTHPFGQEVLAAAGLYPTLSRLLMKGYFFYPYLQFIEAPHTSPTAAHPTHGKGWWCREHAIEAMLAQEASGALWEILPRFHWLSPAYHQNNTLLLGKETLFKQLQSHFSAPPTCGTAILVAALQEDELGGWQEHSRGFIVPDFWPEIRPRKG